MSFNGKPAVSHVCHFTVIVRLPGDIHYFQCILLNFLAVR